MVIAGFASWAAQGSPLDVQVAAVLREELTSREWKSGQRSVSDLRGLIDTKVGFQLKLLGTLLCTSRPAPDPRSLDLQTLAAAVNKKGVTEIVRIRSTPRVRLLGPFDLATPTYGMDSETTLAEHFVALSAGADVVARRILDGTVHTQDNRILEYYRSRNAGQLDTLSLDALQNLAAAILAETKRATPFVGGEDQIGVFLKKGVLRWLLPDLPTDRQKLLSTILHLGFSQTPDGVLTTEEYARVHGKTFISEVNMSLVQPFEQPFTQIFMGGFFRDVAISLDGNVFAGDVFQNVRFKYQGGAFFAANNVLANCVVETPPNVPLPVTLQGCRREEQPRVVPDGALGVPVYASARGCVTRDGDGHLRIKTKGRQRGIDCKGSGVSVPVLPALAGRRN